MLTALLIHALLHSQSETLPVEDLDLSAIQQDWGSPHKDKSVDEHTLMVAGKAYSHGIGTHAVSHFDISLGGKAVSFSAMGGLDDEATRQGSVTFEVWVDGKRVATSPVLKKGSEPVELSANLTGAKRMTLMVTDAGDGNDNDHADWLNPVITVMPGAKKAVHAYTPPPEPMPVIAHGFGAKPQINGPRIVGCTAGHEFLFKIPASGERPLKYAVTPLPEGLTLDADTGVISGKLRDAERFSVEVSVTGPKGKDSRNFTIDGTGTLALTPPMGWNSWNVWANSVTGPRVLAAAKSFISTGLADYGYSYINIDDTWEGPRGADGMITTNDKFPDMKGLADSVHALGLHIGIYSSPGPTTCAGFPASYQFEQQDADQYAKWGFDYLKYDWCSYGGIEPKPDLAGLEKPYTLMHQKLVASGRDIVFSLCQYGMGNVWDWGASVGGNLWRCTGDINDSWSSLSGIAFQGDKWVKGAGPGHWNDPDMLVVGKLGWGDKPRPTKLTPNEQMTHITMWALLAAPLMIGCDLTQIDPFTLDLLTNHDVIEVDQDFLGQAATRLAKDGDTEVWGRQLWDGTSAVGLFNRGEEPAKVHLNFSDLHIDGTHSIRDLWRMKNLGKYKDGYTVIVPRHGAALIAIQ